MTDSKLTSIEIGRAALKIAVTGSRSEEQRIKQELAEQGIRSTAVDFGGEFIPSIVKIVERAVVAAQRQGLVSDTHVGAGISPTPLSHSEVVEAMDKSIKNMEQLISAFIAANEADSMECGCPQCMTEFGGFTL